MKDIYWIEILEREMGTVDSKRVIESYPFPDVEYSKFGLDIFSFESQIFKIRDPMTRLATHTRYKFIVDQWHPKNFFRVVCKPWKYSV